MQAKTSVFSSQDQSNSLGHVPEDQVALDLAPGIAQRGVFGVHRFHIASSSGLSETPSRRTSYRAGSLRTLARRSQAGSTPGPARWILCNWVPLTRAYAEVVSSPRIIGATRPGTDSRVMTPASTWRAVSTFSDCFCSAVWTRNGSGALAVSVQMHTPDRNRAGLYRKYQYSWSVDQPLAPKTYKSLCIKGVICSSGPIAIWVDSGKWSNAGKGEVV
jgi:hypothetical protein